MHLNKKHSNPLSSSPKNSESKESMKEMHKWMQVEPRSLNTSQNVSNRKRGPNIIIEKFEKRKQELPEAVEPKNISPDVVNRKKLLADKRIPPLPKHHRREVSMRVSFCCNLCRWKSKVMDSKSN